MGFAVATLAFWLVLSAGAGASGFTVVIDPGHGGSNRGAPTKQPDTFEKHVTLAIAKRV
jgi:N-acetylmuramoyl-L-alanine amidase